MPVSPSKDAGEEGKVVEAEELDVLLGAAEKIKEEYNVGNSCAC
jgi:hypothetical protein